MANLQEKKEADGFVDDEVNSQNDVAQGELINASGHVQEVDRNFGLFSLTGYGLVNGNVWPALGGTLGTAIFNGGPPGTIYEFLVACFFYFVISASIAELASAIPSTAGIYHWASVTPGKKYGRIVGYYAGYWNFFGWLFGGASASAIAGNTCVQMWAVTHPDYVFKEWHVWVVYFVLTWFGCFTVCYGNKLMPLLNIVGVFFIVAGVLITVVVCIVMPARAGGPGHATSAFVWKDWIADIGYPNGFVFLAGMLNGAYAIGTPDLCCHLAEEIPQPHINLPKAIGLQMGIGFLTAFVYLIAILYATNDFEALYESPFPIALIYKQATGSEAGANGLLFLLLITAIITSITSNITMGRGLWTLARDGATPFPDWISKVSTARGMPFNATITCAVLAALFSFIYLGSKTAFNALASGFVLLTTASYTAAILPNLLTGRKNIKYGPFHLKGWMGFAMNGVACVYMIFFFVVFCFPFALPTKANTMNYASVIFSGVTAIITGWYVLGGSKGYRGPQTIGGKVYQADLVKKVSEVVTSA